MCNPRRIRVRATRELAEAWAQEVRRQATRTGSAAGQARVSEPLADTVGGPTLAALTQVLARHAEWTEHPDGTFTHQLDGGVITFDPATRELEITATVTAEVTVTEEAAATVEAQVSGTVEAEGVGTYYDDGWGGLTEQTAQRDAERHLSRAMDEALRQRREQATREADAAAADAVRAGSGGTRRRGVRRLRRRTRGGTAPHGGTATARRRRDGPCAVQRGAGGGVPGRDPRLCPVPPGQQPAP